MNDKNILRLQLVSRTILALFSCIFVIGNNKCNVLIHLHENGIITDAPFRFVGWQNAAFIAPAIGLILVLASSRIQPVFLVMASELLLFLSFLWVGVDVLVWTRACIPAFDWGHWLNYYHNP